MTKTLGQVAYEAFHSDPLIPSELIRHWYSQATYYEHEAWEAAAQAVATAFQMRALVPDEAQADAQHAVIEAARAYVSEYRKPYRPSTGHAYQELMKAVEALDKAEAGDE
jgi:hypothetical protein